jgi:hypothetical protein
MSITDRIQLLTNFEVISYSLRVKYAFHLYSSFSSNTVLYSILRNYAMLCEQINNVNQKYQLSICMLI